MQSWLAPVPLQLCVGAIANRGQWEQGSSLFMATDLGPVKATSKKKILSNLKTAIFCNVIIACYPCFSVLFLRFPFFILSFFPLVTEKDEKTCFHAETNDFD